MESFGFSDAILQEGWNRLEACAELALVEEPSFGPNPKIVESLDAFENVWFAVVKATLKGNYPEVHDALFAKLWQGSGRDTAMTVGTFLKRLREMAAGEGVYADHGSDARTLLAARGLSDSVVAEAEELIATIKTTVKIDQAKLITKEDQEKAVAHLWVWYREWSAIASDAVKVRRVLSAMGFLKGSGGLVSSDEELFDEETDSAEDAVVETEDPGAVAMEADEKEAPIAAE
jgi:hypothetical protein